MAVDKKISQLTSLAQVDVSASTDVLPIVDTSATETKKITVSALVGAGATAGISGAVLTNGTINSTTIGATTPSTGAFTTLSASGAVSLNPANANVSLAPTGTGVVTINPATAGTMNNVAIGGSSAAAGTFTSATVSTGNLTFSSTAQRITGDMSNATTTSRLMFQSSTTNGNTVVSAIPNGTGTTGGFDIFNNSDLTNPGRGRLFINASEMRVSSEILGTGTYLPLTFYTGGSERMRLDTSGNLGIGTASPVTRLHVLDALSGGQLIVANSETNAAEKYGTFATQHYTNAQSPALGMAVQSNSTDNNILIGGALGEFNAATTVRFYTAANNTTTTGTERMRIDSSGNVGIGVTPTVNLDVKNAGGNCTISAQYGTGTKGQLIAASNEVQLKAFNGTNDVLTFATGASERMRIDSSGNVGIGGTADANAKVQIKGTLPTSSNSSIGFIASGTSPSGSTSAAYGFYSNYSTAAASFTLTDQLHFYANPVAKGAGSTIGNQYGFFASSGLTEATNNFGFYSAIASGSNRWNFYAAGTAANYFAGTVQNGSTISVGAATPAASGAGVTFPATQSASSDANTLDDYEEGTWTPTLKNASSSSTFTSNTGRYTKIGRLVYCSFVNDSGNTGTAGSDITLSGLPFAYGGTSNVPTLVAFTANGLPAAVNCYLSRTINGSTSFVVRDAAGNSLTNQLTFAAGTIIYEV